MSIRGILVLGAFAVLGAAVGCDTGSPANPKASDKPPANLPQPIQPAGPPGPGQQPGNQQGAKPAPTGV
jgi:hypothetical protein